MKEQLDKDELIFHDSTAYTNMNDFVVDYGPDDKGIVVDIYKKVGQFTIKTSTTITPKSKSQK